MSMATEQQQVVEQLVIQFPAIAAWVIVILLATIAGIAGLVGRKFLQRMDTQDTMLGGIKELLALEVSKLRELHHEMDRRVSIVETVLKITGKLPSKDNQ